MRTPALPPPRSAVVRRRVLVVALALGLVGCSGELTLIDPPDGLGDVGGADAGDTGRGDNTAARELWESDVAPLLSATRPKGVCTTCHQGAGATVGPKFLGAGQAENYAALLATTLVGATPEASRFLTIGEHTGNGFCTGVDTPVAGCAADEAAVVAGWIDLLNTP